MRNSTAPLQPNIVKEVQPNPIGKATKKVSESSMHSVEKIHSELNDAHGAQKRSGGNCEKYLSKNKHSGPASNKLSSNKSTTIKKASNNAPLKSNNHAAKGLFDKDYDKQFPVILTFFVPLLVVKIIMHAQTLADAKGVKKKPVQDLSWAKENIREPLFKHDHRPVDRDLLNEELLTRENYREKFHQLLCREEEEHEKILKERYLHTECKI